MSIFFYGHKDDKISEKCLSQMWPCLFEVDGLKYSSAEQYMMYSKAILFNDDEIAKKIMISESPKECKALGRKVRNFDTVIWDKEKYSIVVRGNMAKFQQNEELKAYLFSTGEEEIVEASPFDRVWGIGIRVGDPRINDRSKWGSNLLGKALMEVREKLKQ